jgi:hypothetical protein
LACSSAAFHAEAKCVCAAPSGSTSSIDQVDPLEIHPARDGKGAVHVDLFELLATLLVAVLAEVDASGGEAAAGRNENALEHCNLP